MMGEKKIQKTWFRMFEENDPEDSHQPMYTFIGQLKVFKLEYENGEFQVEIFGRNWH